MTELNYLIELKKISKAFPGVKALEKVYFSLKRGEVHALLGENGAGKSTLIKIIGGIVERDEGDYLINGVNVVNLTPKKAHEYGIAVIHQELNLCQDLTVAENIFLGREISKHGCINVKEMNRKAKEILRKLKIEIEPDIVLNKLSISKQQIIEIAKALSARVKILVMDEPTSALTEKETADLFEIIKNLKKEGCAVIYISHKLEEIEVIADRVTILRDGKHIITKSYNETNLNEIMSYMVGREIKDKYPSIKCAKGKKIFEARNIVSGIVNNVSFELYEGEILGFAGLMGAGRTELMRALFGAEEISFGEMFLNGKRLKIRTPQDAIREGIVLAPEDRRRGGLFVKLSIRENIGLANMDKMINKCGIVNRKVEEQLTQSLIEKFRIVTSSMEKTVEHLSGGNQQKVVLGKWLARNSKIVIFDEPTKGIDVGAKLEIYNIMNELKSQGIGVIFVSSEMLEILGMSDRVLVMCNGRITGGLLTSDTTPDEVLRYATKFNN